MSILYLLTTPPPALEGTDAVFQDVASLRQRFQGDVINLSPLKSSIRRFPKQLYGFHNILEIRNLERRSKLNHVFFSYPYPFPILRFLHNPIVYTVSASLDVANKPPACAQLRKLRRIVVSNERDAAVLKAWGLTNYSIVPPGVDTAGVTPTALPLGQELVLLMASAPWHSRQFHSKGIDLLLATAARLPFLRLILLWRGVLVDEITSRVQRYDIGNRVEVVNRKVNINDYLKKAHATVLLANNGGLVKAFPHSLVESIAAGKPVLLSDTIAMADYVRNHHCGVVVPAMTFEALTAAIETLRHDYELLARNTNQIERDAFSFSKTMEAYGSLYGL
jgi:glycosyltransferase involved in cell wall biosynthesis